MRFDRHEHVAESSKHMRANGFPLIGAADRAYAALVGGDTEMIGPEPDQPLNESDFRAPCGMDARLGLAQIKLLRNARRRRVRWRRILFLRRRRVGLRLRRSCSGGGLPCSPLLLLELKRQACGFCAR